MTLTRLIVFFDVHAQKLTWILAGLTVVAGGFYSLWLGERLRYIDERDYFTLAENLLQFRAYSSDGINPSAFRPPGYPMLLAAMRLLGAPIFMLRMLNFVALAAIVVLLQRWTVRLFQHRGISVVAAGLPLCYPVLFYTAGALYPQIIAAFLLLVLVERLSRVSIAIRFAHIVQIGLISSLLLLMIPAVSFVLPVLAIWLGFQRHRKEAVLLCMVGFLLPAAWSIRNRVVFGEWVYISANSGFNLYLGNSADTTPNSGTNVARGSLDAETIALNDVQRDHAFRDAGLDWIRNNPQRAAVLYTQKILNYFNFRNELATQSESSSTNDILMFATYYPLLALVLARLVLARRSPLTTTEWVIIIIYLLNALTTAIFFTRIRFRLPFDMLLFVMVAGLLAAAQKKSQVSSGL